jgi:hypothetical protein
MSAVKDNVIRLYDVKPEMALEHLKRSTGLEFSDLPQSLVRANQPAKVQDSMQVPPILTDIVDMAVYGKA